MELPPPLLRQIFPSETVRRDILKRGLGHPPPPEALALGKKYRHHIESGFHTQVSIEWIHPKVGYGVFARERIKKCSYVGEYTGMVRENERIYFAPLNDYCYKYPVIDRLGRFFVIDATQGNFTRYINHSYQPNLEPLYAFIDGFYHLIFRTLRQIAPGEQLLYNYGQGYWTIREKPETL